MKLAIGTVQFGLPYGIANQSGQVNMHDVRGILSLARSSGIDTLDTAIAYGSSEACIGQVGVKEFKVITKLPSLPENIIDVNEKTVHSVIEKNFPVEILITNNLP